MQYPSTRLLVLQLDVTSRSAIVEAFRRSKEAFGRIDVVYNNAAYTFVGEVEGTPDSVSRALFDVNFWGMVDVSTEAIRFFRDVNPPGVGGRLLQVSSFLANEAFPCAGFYSAR